MSAIEDLARMFESVPLPSERPPRRTIGREVPSHFVPDDVVLDVIEDPKSWLSRFYIPIRHVPPELLRSNVSDRPAAAMFCHHSKLGEHVKAEVRIPNGADINDPNTERDVWHEIGHAVDLVGVRECQLIATPHGMYSTQFIKVLREYQETIISWSPHENREYKTRPGELWAEVVAYAVMDEGRVPAAIMEAVRPTLIEKLIPVGKFTLADL